MAGKLTYALDSNKTTHWFLPPIFLSPRQTPFVYFYNSFMFSIV